ncbi:TetR/AcrR family transcriptional regulator [Natronospirillum operosum]|uniref:TetR/AcrR family transcriptional regulator n=1 Tax=Natronospirillum operosum TaxID=2759953 RepID=UPI001436C4D9|nr:TetR/AcrR family transcriptional regulator [Natronospirillum operosum]
MLSFIEQTRRTQIVNAAIEVLAEEGYARTSLARIATHAGISKGVITYHFKSKDELFAEVFRQVVEDAGLYIMPHIKTAGSPRERLSTYITLQIRYMAEHRSALLAIGQLAYNHGGDGAGADYISAATQDELGLLEQILAEGQATGEFRPFDCRIMALTVSKAIEAALTDWAWNPNLNLLAYGDEIVALFDHGLQAVSPAGAR